MKFLRKIEKVSYFYAEMSGKIALLTFIIQLQLVFIYGSDLYDDYREQGKNFTSWLCEESWTCTNDDPLTTDLCYCDDLCIFYDDCCWDVKTEDRHHNFYRYLFKGRCMYNPAVNIKSMVFWVDFCPNSSNIGNKLRGYCENPDEDDVFQSTPASGNSSKLLYRNMYCAMCHSEDYILWKPTLNCGWLRKYQGAYDVQELMSKDECMISFDPPSPHLGSRECFPVVKECPSSVTDNGCLDGPRTLVFGNSVYKNERCAICHEGYNKNLTCIPDYDKIITNRQKRKHYNYSYRLLVDFNTLSSRTTIAQKRSYGEKEEDISGSCNERMMYDPFSQTCREIYCEFPFSYQEGKCLSQPVQNIFRDKNTSVMNDTFHLGCPYIRLNKSEFVLTNESGVQVLSSGEFFEASESVIGQDYALVCIRVGMKPINMEDSVILMFTSVESILSLICECLSIICLLIGVIIYICIPNLRNIPGRNLLCLMTCLLLGQMFFICAPLAVGQEKTCVSVAVIIHYSFLASFFWMNIMAVDMFLTFSRGIVASRGETNKRGRRFLYYCSYAFCTPLFIIITALSIEYGTEMYIKPQYGRIICWFGSEFGLLYFFLLPLFFLLFLNIICFVATARSIYTTDKTSSRVLRRKNSCKLLIYIKLSVVMGLTWIFAGMAIFANVPALWILFVIFNGLQGVLIFISFVCSRKIYRILNKNYVSLSSTTRSFFSRYTGNNHSSDASKTNMSIITGNSRVQNESSL